MPTNQTAEASMAKYRKKPVVIEAVQFLPQGPGSGGSFDAMPKWLEEAYANGTVTRVEEPGKGARLRIKTLEGPLYGDAGDWIIRGVKGEIYACKPDIFAATYEPAE
jgi:hypothetical protein